MFTIVLEKMDTMKLKEVTAVLHPSIFACLLLKILLYIFEDHLELYVIKYWNNCILFPTFVLT